MILGDDWQMLMVTEEQDHEYLKKGKRNQKMCENRPLPKKLSHFTSIYIEMMD